MSKKKNPSKPKKVDFLELPSSKKARFLKKNKRKLRQKLLETDFGTPLLKRR
jgi:hypothetical protein